jgi:hypothetical protein
MDRLHADQRLAIGEELTSHNARVRLVMQGDGNLVLYRTDDGVPLWSSDTWQQPVTHAVMQQDGPAMCVQRARVTVTGWPGQAASRSTSAVCWAGSMSTGGLNGCVCECTPVLARGA